MLVKTFKLIEHSSVKNELEEKVRKFLTQHSSIYAIGFIDSDFLQANLQAFRIANRIFTKIISALNISTWQNFFLVCNYHRMREAESDLISKKLGIITEQVHEDSWKKHRIYTMDYQLAGIVSKSHKLNLSESDISDAGQKWDITKRSMKNLFNWINSVKILQNK